MICEICKKEVKQGIYLHYRTAHNQTYTAPKRSYNELKIRYDTLSKKHTELIKKYDQLMRTNTVLKQEIQKMRTTTMKLLATRDQ